MQQAVAGRGVGDDRGRGPRRAARPSPSTARTARSGAGSPCRPPSRRSRSPRRSGCAGASAAPGPPRGRGARAGAPGPRRPGSRGRCGGRRRGARASRRRRRRTAARAGSITSCSASMSSSMREVLGVARPPRRAGGAPARAPRPRRRGGGAAPRPTGRQRRSQRRPHLGLGDRGVLRRRRRSASRSRRKAWCMTYMPVWSCGPSAVWLWPGRVSCWARWSGRSRRRGLAAHGGSSVALGGGDHDATGLLGPAGARLGSTRGARRLAVCAVWVRVLGPSQVALGDDPAEHRRARRAQAAVGAGGAGAAARQRRVRPTRWSTWSGATTRRRGAHGTLHSYLSGVRRVARAGPGAAAEADACC